MRRIVWACGLFLCLGVAVAQLTPDSGVVSGNSYQNAFFRLTFPFPSGFTPTPDKSQPPAFKLLHLISPSTGEYLAISAEPAGPATDAKAYVEAVAPRLAQQGFNKTGEAVYNNWGGLFFHGATYKADADGKSQYIAVAATVSHNYLVELVFSATSQDQLEELLQAAKAMVFQPDWTSGEPLDDSAPPGVPHRIRISQGVSEGILKGKVAPKYPDVARKNGIQGMVVLHALVGKDGLPNRLDVITGNPLLAESAVKAVSQWTYKPYVLNGNPVPFDTQITVTYVLNRR